MAVYSITYDLVKSKDYSRIIEGIKKISAENWAKPTKSQWIITSPKTSTEIRDFLNNYIDSDDVLFVIEVDGSNWAARNIPREVVTWMNS